MVMDLADSPFQQNRQDKASSRMGQWCDKGKYFIPIQAKMQHLADEGSHPRILGQHYSFGKARRTAGIKDADKILAIMLDLKHFRWIIVNETL